ncbi:MAG: glycosyl hydrolase, partial [Planctomycetota bacterium]
MTSRQPQNTRKIFIVGLIACHVLITLLLISFCGCTEPLRQPQRSGISKEKNPWPQASKENKPWTYWWWLGSIVEEKGLTEHLEAYQKAGMGGVHIISIYGVKGEEDRFIEYLSPRWIQMLAHTTAQAERLGMGVDMSTGTGWPFGGPDVGPFEATKKAVFKTYTLESGEQLTEPVRVMDESLDKPAILKALMALSDSGSSLNLTEKVKADGTLDWTAPEGQWKLYAVFQALGAKKVERAAPGGEGYILDPFSQQALNNYLKKFDNAFADYKGRLPRAHYHDSYEYGPTTWTEDFFEQFKRRRGYDLRNQLPSMMNQGDEDTIARVKCDYRETIADLHLEEYIMPWTKWAHDKGSLTRNQAHGSPSNLLDTYAAADIPETEIFGYSNLEIPGLHQDPDFQFHDAHNDPLMLKFSSSAAHVTGSTLVSSETCTWLGEHFKVALSQVKPEIDHVLISGINHVIYHGMAYSPFDEPWPGWMFYASTNFAPSNSFWRDLPELNAYVARCQSILQSGESDNDVLLYWPIHDLWHNKDGMDMTFSVHRISNWLYPSEFYKTAKKMWDRGYTFDYISDRQIANISASSGVIKAGDSQYKVIVVPKCRLMPPKTLNKLLELAENGATIVFIETLPGDVPGLGELETRREALEKDLAKIKSQNNERILLGDNIEQMLLASGVDREKIADTNGVEFIRRTHPDGHQYFIANLGKNTIDQWITFAVRAESAMLLDPISARYGAASLRETANQKKRVYLQLKPGQSIILKTFSSEQTNEPKWRYLKTTRKSFVIKGT